MDVDYDLNVKELNERWAKQENIDSWSQLIIKHTEDTIGICSEALNQGIYKMFDNGHIQFDRMDTHRRAVESENEAFSRIPKKAIIYTKERIWEFWYPEGE